MVYFTLRLMFVRGTEDMKHIDQPRGAGTAYRFKMKTPKSLNGMTDPKTGKIFKRWIIRNFGGERHLVSAKRLRDICLAEVRTMEREALAGSDLSGRFSPERAELWAEARRVQDAAGGSDEYEPDIRDLIYDEAERAPPAQRKAFQKVALSGTLSIANAVTRYLHDRREGNGHGYASLAKTTMNDLRVATRYLCAYAEETDETLFLEDVTSEMVSCFRGDFLPAQTSPRAPSGLSLATIEKLCGLLRNLWKWSLAHQHVAFVVNPFDLPKGVRRQKRNRGPKGGTYSSLEATAIMEAFPSGGRLGDIFRLSLVTGCRADELAKVKLVDVTEGAAFFTIRGGKTDNAVRTIPVPQVARKLVLDRLPKAHNIKQERLFWDFPLRPATGKASALSQLFTRERRKVLGKETNGRLTFHSLRHTWFTKARQAGVPLSDANDLGGWAGERTSSSAYDHGLLMADLAKRQEQVAARLEQDGYLSAF